MVELGPRTASRHGRVPCSLAQAVPPCEPLRAQNLALLRERDTELETYDRETATLRNQLEERAAALSAAHADGAFKERQLEDERKRAGGLKAKLAESEARARELSDQSARKGADVARLQTELDEALSQRKSALAQVGSAQGEAAERATEIASVRNELALRLQQQQQQMAEADEGWRGALQDERAQGQAKLKASRAEATREASALQEQIDKLQAELADAGRSHEAAHEELRALREAASNDSLRSSRMREDMKRLSGALAESQSQVIALTQRLEMAEQATRQHAAEHAAALERAAEEHRRQAGAATRASEEREAAAARAKEEEGLSRRKAAEARAVELEAALAKERGRVGSAEASLAAAEERARASHARAEQLAAEKATVLRDAGSMRAEAVASRERAEVLQKMLTQRTEYLRKLQLAAAKREEQLEATHAGRERESVQEVEMRLLHERAHRERAESQLDESRRLHAESERQVAILQVHGADGSDPRRPEAARRPRRGPDVSPDEPRCVSPDEPG